MTRWIRTRSASWFRISCGICLRAIPCAGDTADLAGISGGGRGGYPQFSAQERTLLAEFLERCDLIKFAHAEAGRRESENMLAQAMRFVKGEAHELVQLTGGSRLSIRGFCCCCSSFPCCLGCAGTSGGRRRSCFPSTEPLRALGRLAESKAGNFFRACSFWAGVAHRWTGAAAEGEEHHAGAGERDRYHDVHRHVGLDACGGLHDREPAGEPGGYDQTGDEEIHRRAAERPDRADRICGAALPGEPADAGSRLAVEESGPGAHRPGGGWDGDRVGHRVGLQPVEGPEIEEQGDDPADGRRQQCGEDHAETPRRKRRRRSGSRSIRSARERTGRCRTRWGRMFSGAWCTSRETSGWTRRI